MIAVHQTVSIALPFRSITKPIEPSERDGNGVLLQGANTYHLHEALTLRSPFS
jgi:hypothetical protein